MYDYTLGYNRAIGCVSRTTKKQYFQGSSLNRPKRAKSEAKPLLPGQAEAASKQMVESGETETVFGLSPSKGVAKNSYRDGRGISRRSKQKIKDKIFALYRASGHSNFTFSTLTLIGKATDRQACAVLNKFLTRLRQKFGKFVYIWIAERQENGNIHFHVILSRHFDIRYINSLWVTAQLNAGIENAEAVERLKTAKNTTFQHLHRDGLYAEVQRYLNPVDIKKINSIDGLSCYLTNYITKNNDTFFCLPWHCNREVSKLFTKQLVSKKVFAETSCTKKNRITSRKGKTYVNKTYVGEHCIINTIYNKQYYKKHLHELEQINKWILENHEQVDQSVTIHEFDYRRILYTGISSINHN